MSLELVTEKEVGNVQRGLRELGNDAYTFSQDMKARVDTPVLGDMTDIWMTWLDSRTMQHYGKKNEDQRYRFKIDYEFGLSSIINADINPDGSISTSNELYSDSPATEFIIIGKSELEGASSDYAIRAGADKYGEIREALNTARAENRKFSLDDFLKAGGFKVNERLMPDEIVKYNQEKNVDELTWKDIEYVHDGWLEHAVGKSNATKEEYLEAVKLLIKYVEKAREKGCLSDKGVGFYIETGVDEFKVRPWCVDDSDGRSLASGRSSFGYYGRFLRVRSVEGAAREKLRQNYGDALKVILEQPILSADVALSLIGKGNEYLLAQQKAQQ